MGARTAAATYVERAQNLVDLLPPPLDLLLIVLGTKHPSERASFGLFIDCLFNVARCPGNTPSFLPHRQMRAGRMGALFQIRDCRLYHIAQVIDILPLDPDPEDFADFDAVLGQPNEIAVVDHLVLTVSLVLVNIGCS